MDTNIDIAIIINSFNRFELLRSCISSLDWISNSIFLNRIGVIVYEAGSMDGSIEWLAENKKNLNYPLDVYLPKEGENTSFASGINKGVEFAESVYPNLKYLLFYETDNQIQSSLPLKNALDQLNYRRNLAACGFTVTKHNGMPAGLGTDFPKLYHFLLGQQLVCKLHLDRPKLTWNNDVNDSKFSFVDSVYTSPLLVKLSAWKESGGLDVSQFPFADCDIDWAKRLSILGWEMGVIDAEGVIHDNCETISNWSKSRAIQFHRGRLRYFKRFNPLSIYLIWPFPLFFRHMFELVFVKLFIWNKSRRNQLSSQFNNLLKRCIYSYEQ